MEEVDKDHWVKLEIPLEFKGKRKFLYYVGA